MKKVLIVTIFDNPNFGTYLQTIALSLILKKYRLDVEVLNYERPFRHRLKKIFGSYKIYLALQIVYYILRGFYKRYSQQQACKSVVKRFVKVSRTYYDYNQILKDVPVADIYLTGSDQVWNTIHNNGIDKTFYLAFAPQDSVKVSYAASIGMDCIPIEYKRQIAEMLSKYKKISVREEANISLLSEIGIASELVLDPTLLLNRDEWLKITPLIKENDPYILVYSVESESINKLVGKVAKEVSNILGIKTIEISYGNAINKIVECDEHISYATPLDFISYIAYAEFVVISSFHGTAFSVNFNKQFITIAPERFSSRIDSLLKIINLRERKLSYFDANNICALCDNPIDFSECNFNIQKYREKSFKYIENNII